MSRSPGTWRRLKILAEARLGHGVPGFPPDELDRLLGLLVALEQGRGDVAVASDALQGSLGRGEREARGLSPDDVRVEIRDRARRVDARAFL